MKRFCVRRSVLTLAFAGLVFTSFACDTMESDERRADKRIGEAVRNSSVDRQIPTTQGLIKAITALNTAASDASASSLGKIRAKSQLAETEYEAGDRTLRDLDKAEPAVSRALWEIGLTAAQIQAINGTATALAVGNPEATLKAIADKRAQMVSAGEAASKAAAELQSQIDKVKGQVNTLTQQKDAAMAQADAAADKASKANPKEASALLDTSGEARRKGGNLGHEIDRQAAALLPLERDLAVEQLKKKNADEGVAMLDETRKTVEAMWQTVQTNIAAHKAAAAQLGEQLAAQAKTLDELTKQAEDLRAKALDQFNKSAAHYDGAANEAKALAGQLGTWSNKFSTSPERKAWDQLKLIYNMNIFRLGEAEAQTAVGAVYGRQATMFDAREKLAAAIAPTLTAAGITTPTPLADAAQQKQKALAARADAYAKAAQRFVDAKKGGGTPKDVQLAAGAEAKYLPQEIRDDPKYKSDLAD
jgi:chromosome segregation ATPase